MDKIGGHILLQHPSTYHNSCSDASSTEWCIMASFFQGILNIFQPSLSSHGIPSSWAISSDITSQIQWLNLLVWVPSSAKGPRRLHPQLCCWHPYDKWFLYSVLLPNSISFPNGPSPKQLIFTHLSMVAILYSCWQFHLIMISASTPPMLGIAG